MRKLLWTTLIVVGLLALYAGAFAAMNASSRAQARDIEFQRAAIVQPAGDTLELMTWNLGYGGLGAGSDFIADGGAHYFPPSRAAARANVAGIAATVREQAPDIDMLLFQEIAAGGPVNYWNDVHGAVDEALRGRTSAFFADFKTRLMPWPLRMVHGQAIYSRLAIDGVDVVALPAEDASIFGVKRRYASLVSRLDGDVRWTVASAHLAAFDADAAVRTRQLRELMAWAEAEYGRGRHVVIGADWNLQLVETNFPHTTEDKFLFWLFPFPQDALPAGWRIAADPATPSVRTNERPYRPGENYTTVIDGFIVSPNVEIESVRGVDLGFAHADHQPVRARLRAIR